MYVCLTLSSRMNFNEHRYRQAADRGWPPAQTALERLRDRQEGGLSDPGMLGEGGRRSALASATTTTVTAARRFDVTTDGVLSEAAAAVDEPKRDAPLEEALAWYRTAAELGDVHAQAQLGACLRHRHRITSPTSASSGSSIWNSSSSGGLTSTRGNGVVLVEALRDVAGAMEAAHWLEAASASGHAGAAATLAVLYLEGRLPKVIPFAPCHSFLLLPYCLHLI